jgi:hypothetical protein
MTENELVDPFLAKGRLILVETEAPKPPLHVHGGLPIMRRIIARRRGSVQRAIYLGVEIDFGRPLRAQTSRPSVARVRHRRNPRL